jgi:hypothetical protein
MLRRDDVPSPALESLESSRDLFKSPLVSGPRVVLRIFLGLSLKEGCELFFSNVPEKYSSRPQYIFKLDQGDNLALLP